MDAHAQAQASYVRQALAVEGGHLFLGPNGATLHFAPGARARGFPCEAVKAACLAAGLPVIDCRAVPFQRLYAVVVEGPMVAVGRPPDPQPWHSLSDAPLAHVAALYGAAGAEVSNVPGVPGPGAGSGVVSASWSLGHLWLRVGESGPLRIIAREDGSSGRTVCLIPGHLAWQAPDGSVVDLLDEDDIAHARLIAAALRLSAALAALVTWSAQTGHGDARPWQDARALLDALRNPRAGN